MRRRGRGSNKVGGGLGLLWLLLWDLVMVVSLVLGWLDKGGKLRCKFWYRGGRLPRIPRIRS